MNVFITGGTGFIGRHLIVKLLNQGYNVTVATRHPDRHNAASFFSLSNKKKSTSTAEGKSGVSGIQKDETCPKSERIQFVSISEDVSLHLRNADVVINLAGESLFGKRWSATVKKRLYESRILTTKALVNAMKKEKVNADGDKSAAKPFVFISASAVGYYGDCGSDIITEKTKPGNDFLAKICRDWELAALEAESVGIRVVTPRIGIALGLDGGALAPMLPLFRNFLGGSFAPGTQYFPWIHIDDLCDSLLYAIQNQTISGAYNAAAPEPVSMDFFTKQLGITLARPSFFKVPDFALSLALGEAASMLTSSLRAIPEKIQQAGFLFKYETVESALDDLLDKKDIHLKKTI